MSGGGLAAVGMNRHVFVRNYLTYLTALAVQRFCLLRCDPHLVFFSVTGKRGFKATAKSIRNGVGRGLMETSPNDVEHSCLHTYTRVYIS